MENTLQDNIQPSNQSNKESRQVTGIFIPRLSGLNKLAIEQEKKLSKEYKILKSLPGIQKPFNRSEGGTENSAQMVIDHQGRKSWFIFERLYNTEIKESKAIDSEFYYDHNNNNKQGSNSLMAQRKTKRKELITMNHVENDKCYEREKSLNYPIQQTPELKNSNLIMNNCIQSGNLLRKRIEISEPLDKIITNNTVKEKESPNKVPFKDDTVDEVAEVDKLVYQVNCFISKQMMPYQAKTINPSNITERSISLYKNRFVYLPFQKKNFWQFSRLYKFLETIYLSDTYKESLLRQFLKKEKIVLLKLIGFSKAEVNRFITQDDEMFVLRQSFIYLNSSKIITKTNKLTNNKRFVFRKIRSIMLSKYLKKINKFEGTTKQEKDECFFNYYFKNEPEFIELSAEEVKDVENLFLVYYETKIDILWKFKKFREDFCHIFFNFFDEVKEWYYKEALSSLLIYLKYINDKDIDTILNSTTHMKKLPYNRFVLKTFLKDFFSRFGKSFCVK